MDSLKSFLAVVGMVVLIVCATAVTIAALWGKDRRHVSHENDDDANNCFN